MIAPAPDTPDTERERPLPQSGTLTAGDYDDVLNPGLYKAYLDKALQGPLGRKDLPFVDAADRIEIVLTDRLGKPMPFAEILVQDGNGETMFPLVTGAKGRVFLYPQFDALGGAVTLKASAPGSQGISHTLDLSGDSAPDKLTLSFASDAPKIEVAIKPGRTAFTRMPYLESSAAANLEKCATPFLATE